MVIDLPTAPSSSAVRASGSSKAPGSFCQLPAQCWKARAGTVSCTSTVAPAAASTRLNAPNHRAVAAVCANPVVADGHRLPVSLSAGIAAWEPGTGFDEVYRVADTRMYGVKREGKSLGLFDD